MRNSVFYADQYVSSALVNTFSTNITTDFALAGSSDMVPGLIKPAVTTITAAGLVATLLLPAPFAVLFGSGVYAQAHGLTTGTDSSTYVVDLTSSLPVSGSALVFVLAQQASVSEDPQQIVGPPPGHPDYDPNFVPFTGYLTSLDTLSIAPSLTPADNVTTFELFRTTLTAGQTATMVLDFSNRVLSTSLPLVNTLKTAGNKSLALSDAGIIQQAQNAGTYTLPPAAQCEGYTFTVSSRTQAGVTLQVGFTGDEIYGSWAAPISAVAALVLSFGQSITVVSDGVGFQTIALSGALGGTGLIGYFPTTAVPAGWLACDGSAVSRTTYSALFALIQTAYGAGNGFSTFNLPDMRGVVARGLDNGRGLDPARVIGTLQTSQNAAHTHTFSGSNSNTFPGSGTGNAVGSVTVTGNTGLQSANHIHDYSVPGSFQGSNQGGGSAGSGVIPQLDTFQTAGVSDDHFHSFSGSGNVNLSVNVNVSTPVFMTISGNTSSSGGTEARMTNVALLACISVGFVEQSTPVNPSGSQIVYVNSSFLVSGVVDTTYLIDTTSGAVSGTLPLLPVQGITYNMKKISTDANNMAILGNGHNLDGVAGPIVTASSIKPSYALQYNSAGPTNSQGFWTI